MTGRTLTARQLKFCLLIVEGETQARAYAKAGYKTTSKGVTEVNACRLLKNAQVQQQIALLQANAATRSAISVESVTRNVMRIADKAEADGQWSSAWGAHALVARLHGLITDKKEVEVTHRPAPLPTKAIELDESDWEMQFARPLPAPKREG
jgi:ATP phosphoribosyltransferase